MTDSTERAALIVRLEAAEEMTYGLFNEVLACVAVTPMKCRKAKDFADVGAWTDAARLLVPPIIIEGRVGALWELDYKLNIGPSPEYELLDPPTTYRAGVYRREEDGGWCHASHCYDPALALLIAILKAAGSE